LAFSTSRCLTPFDITPGSTVGALIPARDTPSESMHRFRLQSNCAIPDNENVPRAYACTTSPCFVTTHVCAARLSFLTQHSEAPPIRIHILNPQKVWVHNTQVAFYLRGRKEIVQRGFYSRHKVCYTTYIRSPFYKSKGGGVLMATKKAAAKKPAKKAAAKTVAKKPAKKAAKKK